MGSLLIKPVGDRCNLNCSYCFYHPNRFTPQGEVMSEAVLDRLVKSFLAKPGSPIRRFGWQGGEPTLAGIEFFERVIALQKKYKKPEQIVQNAFQTNGVLVDDAWADFFRENDVLVGLSIDGAPDQHNANRVTRTGSGAFSLAERAWRTMQQKGVAVNILSVVSAANWNTGEESYRFITDQLGADYIQFIPCVEWDGDDGGVMPFSLRPGQYGRFLIDVFNVWKQESTRAISVKLFDDLILFMAGKPMGDCMHASSCGSHYLVDFTGDVYPCDFFVVEKWRIGNILKQDFAHFDALPRTRAFRNQKKKHRGKACRKCPYQDVCQGGCPKLWRPNAGKEDVKNYLCEDMKQFFGTCRGELEAMAKSVKRRMDEIKRAQHAAPNFPPPNRPR